MQTLFRTKISYINHFGPEQPNLIAPSPEKSDDAKTQSKFHSTPCYCARCFAVCRTMAVRYEQIKTKAEKLHLSRVAALGCIVCRNLNYGESPAEIHHCSSGTGLSVPLITSMSFRYAMPSPYWRLRRCCHAGRKSWEEKVPVLS